MLADDPRRRATEHRLAREKKPERRAQGIDVRAAVYRLVFQLLRAGKVGGADVTAGPRRGLRACLRQRTLGQSEIDDFDGQLIRQRVRQDQVGWLDVAVDELVFFGQHERLADLQDDGQRGGYIEGTSFFHDLLKGFAFAELHRVETGTVGRLAEVEDGGDVRVS